jgi:hypothetical protein
MLSDFTVNSTTLKGNQNRPDFADAEKLFLLFEYPLGIPTPQGHDGSYFCSSSSKVPPGTPTPRAMMEAIFVLSQVTPGPGATCIYCVRSLLAASNSFWEIL